MSKNNRLDDILNGIEKYLISDIETMVGMPDRSSGGIGFACFLTILIGMETMGCLLSGETSFPAFKEFWPYVSKAGGIKYKDKSLRGLLYQNGRNGIAHNYTVKRGLQVMLNTGRHLSFSDDGSVLHINCKELFKVFSEAYSDAKKALKDLSDEDQQNKASKFLKNNKGNSNYFNNYQGYLKRTNLYNNTDVSKTLFGNNYPVPSGGTYDSYKQVTN